MPKLNNIYEFIKIVDLIFYQIVFSVFLLMHNDTNMENIIMICFIASPLFSALAPPAAVYLSLSTGRSITSVGRRNLTLFFITLLVSWLLVSMVLKIYMQISISYSVFSLLILINAALTAVYRRSYKGMRASSIELAHKAVISCLIGIMLFIPDKPHFRYIALGVITLSVAAKLFNIRNHLFVNKLFTDMTHIWIFIQINFMQTLANQLDSIYLALLQSPNVAEFFIFNRIVQSASNIVGATRLFTKIFSQFTRSHIWAITIAVGVAPIVGFMLWRVADILLALSYSFSAMKNTQYGLAINNSGQSVKTTLFISFLAGTTIFLTIGFTASRLVFFLILAAGVLWASSRATSR